MSTYRSFFKKTMVMQYPIPLPKRQKGAIPPESGQILAMEKFEDCPRSPVLFSFAFLACVPTNLNFSGTLGYGHEVIHMNRITFDKALRMAFTNHHTQQ